MLAMRRVYSNWNLRPQPLPIEFEDDGSYPLKVGYCTLAKSMAILVHHGRLARVPYVVHPNTEPAVFCFRMTGPTLLDAPYSFWGPC